ncbi:MAG: hypothetical protein ABI724_15750 [Betaproteobacteria bacterium]
MNQRLVALLSTVACVAAALPPISFAQAAWPEKSVTVHRRRSDRRDA